MFESDIKSSITLTKEELRARMKLLEKDFLSKETALDSDRILQQLENLPEFKSASVILLYCSLSGEVDTHRFIEKWSGIKTIVLPAVVGKEIDLRIYDRGKMERGRFNIEEPNNLAVKVDPKEIELALVPGVAFSPVESGYSRLGRGAGYYDRLLRKMNCIKVGLCFPFRILDFIPVDVYDEPVDKCLF